MPSPTSTSSERSPAQTYTVIPDSYVSETVAADSVNFYIGSHMAFHVATVIEDDDLMFGGKPLSDWHEEECRRHSVCSVAEEPRGRQRFRSERHYDQKGAVTKQ